MLRRNAALSNRRLSYGALWVGLSLILILLDQLGYFHPVEQVTSTVLDPLKQAMHQLGTNLSRYGDFLSDNEKLRAENAQLRQQLQQALGDQGKVAALSNQVDQLEKQLQFHENPDYKNFNGVTADVINRSTNTNLSLTINKGTNDGLKRGLPVVDSSGYLVGRIARADSRTSEVLLITDSSIGVNIYTQRYDSNSRRVAIQPVDGTAVGQYQLGGADKIKIERIQPNADIKPDDWVFTNGMFNTYPANLLVGKVSRVSAQDGQPEKSAVVQPIADLDHIPQVLVITSWGVQ